MGVLKTLVVKITGDISALQNSLTTGAGQVQQWGSQLSATGKSLTSSVTVPLVGAAGAATYFANEFNSGLANVASLGPEAEAAIAGWKPMIQDMAVEVGKGTTDMTGGLYQVVSAFGANNESLEILETNAMAAAAGLSTTTEAINLTSAVTKGYGDTSAEAVQHAADLALRTVQLGQTTFPELAGSVGSVVPLMASLGGTQEELFATMATATGVTGGAAEVSTQLRGVLQSLMAPTEDLTGLMQSLGYENGAAMLQGLGLQGTIAAIVEASASAGEPLQDYIGSIEGQTLALALAGPQAGSFTEKLAAMGNATGTMQTAFAAQTQGINANGFAMQQARVQMQVMAQRLGDALAPALALVLGYLPGLIGWVEGLIGKFTALDPKTQMVILGVVGLVAGLGPLLMILGSVASGVGVVMGLFGALSLPFVVAVGVIIGVAALLYAAWQTNFGGIRDFAAQVWTAIQQGFTAFKALFQGDYQGFLTGIRTAWDTAWNALVAFVGRIWTIVQPKLVAFFGSFKAWWEGIDWKQVGYDAMTKLLETLDSLWDWGQPKLAAFWTSIQTWFTTTDWGSLANNIVDGLVNGIQSAGQAFIDAVVNLAAGAWEAIKDYYGIESPSTLLTWAGQMLPGGLVRGVDMGLPALEGAADRMARAAMPVLPGGTGGRGEGNVTIHAEVKVQAGPGMDVNALAELVVVKLGRLARQRSAAGMGVMGV